MKKIFALIVLTMLLGSVEMVYAKDWDSCDYVRTYEDDYGCDEEFRTYEEDLEWENGGCTPSNNWDSEDESWYEEEKFYEEYNPDVVDDDESQYEEYVHDIEVMYMVTNCRANVRSGPGMNYDIIDVMPEGVDVVVVGETYDCNGKHWYQLSDGSFVSAGTVLTEYDYSVKHNQYKGSNCYYEESNKEIQMYKKVQVDANVRKGPSIKYAVIDGVCAGESIGIISEQDGWYYTDRGGWIAAYLFEKQESSRKCSYGTCIVVDIDTQMVYVYRDGEVFYSSSCVTGTAGVSDTPRGTFCIQDKVRGKTLTDYSTYECDVDYWMPFYEGCGLHDASWRESFGGDIYQYDGSHGCVNLPHDAAETIYNYCGEGTTVIVE